MEMQEFIGHVAGQYDEVEASEFTAATEFKKFEEWSSLTALSILAMIGEEYGVKLKGEDMRRAVTIEDLYRMVESKKG